MPQPAPQFTQPQMTPEQYAALVGQQQSAAPARFNLGEYAKARGIDISQFEGGEPAFADALLRAAQGYMTNQSALSETQAQLQAAQATATQLQQPVAAASVDVAGPDVSKWEHLLVEDNGRVQPKAGAPVPWNVVEAAQAQMDTRRKNMQAILTDPQAAIREHVGGDWLEQQFSERFEKAWADRQREQQVEQWMEHNSKVIWTEQGGQRVMTPEGERLSAIVDEYREQGMKPEFIFQVATRDLEREMLQAEIQHTAQVTAQQTYERNQQAAQYQQYQMQAEQQGQPPFQQTQWSAPPQLATQQPVPVQNYAQSPQQQPSYLDRHVGNQGASAPGSAFTTTSRDSAPQTTGAAVDAADFTAEDPESIARSVAIESGAMNASGELN